MVTCADAEPDGFCDGSVGKSSGSGVGAATLDYLRFNGGATDLTIQPTDSLAVTVEWGADSSTDVCLSSLSITPTGDPAATPATWSEKLGRTGSKAFTQLGASSTNDIQYDFTMTCYNESGSDTATGTRKQVEVKVVVDPSLQGGIVTQIGDTVIDGSIKRRLDQLKNAL